MSIIQLLFSEIAHRGMNFFLSLLAIVVASTSFVASPALLRGYRTQSEIELANMRGETEDELKRIEAESNEALANVEKRTKRIMRDMGFNLRIVHINTDLSKLYADYTAFDMPEEYIDRLAESPELTKVAHLVATLKQMIDFEGDPRLLVGIAPETPQTHIENKPPMGYQIKPGEVFLGALTAGDRKVGDTVEIQGTEFKVSNILPSHGTREEDIAIFMHLADAQKLLDKQGRITEIVAIGCKCKTINRVEEIQAQLELVLPEAKVMEVRNIAMARDQQRQLISSYYQDQMARYKNDREQIMATEKENHGKVLGLLGSLTSVVTPLIVLASAIWIGLMAWANVRERRTEIGLLRALGKKASSVLTLFLGKAVLLGLLGGVLGCGIGIVLGYLISQRLFEGTPNQITPHFDLILGALIGAPMVAAMASYLPALIAARQDPAVVLMDD